MATASEPTRGFLVACPHCGEAGNVTIDASDVSALFCRECDTDITRDDIRTVIGQWERLLAWLGTAPEYPGE